jgi:ubiquinol-cytochrome c reductase cytochrome c subunit
VKNLKSAIGLVFMLACGVAAAQTVPRGDALSGRKIYISQGCYQCHGYQGQGSNAGSRLAPGPMPYVGFAYQVRQPRARMPAYSLKITSDQDLANVYAYLLTIAKARLVAETPLLNDTPIRDESSK